MNKPKVLNTWDRIEECDGNYGFPEDTYIVTFTIDNRIDVVSLHIDGENACVIQSSTLPTNNWRDYAFAYKRVDEFMIYNKLKDYRKQKREFLITNKENNGWVVKVNGKTDYKFTDINKAAEYAKLLAVSLVNISIEPCYLTEDELFVINSL